MADAQKYAEWIVNNRDKSGTPEFDVVVKAYRASRNPVSQVDINGPQGVEGMTGTQKFLAGAGKAFVDVGSEKNVYRPSIDRSNGTCCTVVV